MKRKCMREMVYGVWFTVFGPQSTTDGGFRERQKV